MKLSMQRKITEFTKAEELLLLMSSARTLGDYEEYWKDFLHKIDKGFNKLRDLYKDDMRVKGVIDSINIARKSDPLISYLMQARNSDEHSIRQITERVGGYTKLEGGAGGGVIVSGDIEGGKMQENLVTAGNLKIEFQIEYVEIISVTSRGKKYDPPNISSGKAVLTHIPHQIALIGLNFYLEKLALIDKVLLR